MKQLFCLAAWLGAWVAQAALPPAERLLPADTLGFVTVPDWSVTKSNFAASSLGQFLNDPAMKPFRDKLVANFLKDKLGTLEKQLDIKAEDYAGLIRGQITVALTRNNWDGSPNKKPGLLWLIDTREKNGEARTNLADLRKRWIDKGHSMRTDKIRDIEFTAFIIPADEPKAAAPAPPPGAGEGEAPRKAAEATELLIGASGALLLIGDSARDLEKVLALQAGSSVSSIADQASFAANAPLLRDAGAFAWVDVKTIISAMSRQAREDQAAAPKEQSLFGPAPTFDRILTALGLGDVQTLAANFKTSRDGSLVNVTMNVPESGRRGLLKIMAVDQKDSSPPPFVPADAVKFNRWRIDLQRAWTTIENTLNEISPAYGGVIKLLLDTAGKDTDVNFDLRKLLLSNLGDDVISYEKSPRPGEDPASPPSIVLIGSKNADQMATSLKALTSIIPPSMAKFQEREFLGRKVASFTWPSVSGGKPSLINYAASAGYVAISSDPALIEEFLRSNEGKGRSLRDLPGLNEAAQKVGGMNTGFFAYENQNESMRTSFEAAKKNPSEALSIPGSKIISGALAGGKPSGSSTNWFDPSLLPAFDRVSKFFHMAVTALNVSPRSIDFRIFTPTPPQLRQTGQPP